MSALKFERPVEDGDSGLVELLSFEGSILLLETLEKVRLKNIDDKYTLRGTSLVFTEDLSGSLFPNGGMIRS